MITSTSEHAAYIPTSMHLNEGNDQIQSEMEQDDVALSSLLMLANSSENAMESRSTSSNNSDSHSVDKLNSSSSKVKGLARNPAEASQSTAATSAPTNGHAQNLQANHSSRHPHQNSIYAASRPVNSYAKEGSRSREQNEGAQAVHNYHYRAHKGSHHNQQPVAMTMNITIEDLRRYFHLPIAEVAKHLNTCTTALKKICRKLNITKWPYRQILSLTKSIQSLEMASLNEAIDDDLKSEYRKQILVLRKTIAEVVHNPSKIVVADSINKHADTLEDSGDDENTANAPSSSQAVAQLATQPAEGFTVSPSTGQSLLRDAQQVVEGANNSTPVTGKSDKEEDSNINQIILAAAALISRSDPSPPPGVPIQISKHAKKKSSEEILADIEGHPSVQSAKRSRTSDGVGEEGKGSASNASNFGVLEVGKTSVQYELVNDNTKIVYHGTVQLAPLQRKKIRTPTNKRAVPFLESDIGKQVHIEFTPQFTLSLLHKTLIEKQTLANMQGAYNINSMMAGQGYGGMNYLPSPILPISGIMPAPPDLLLNTYHIHAAYASVLQGRTLPPNQISNVHTAVNGHMAPSSGSYPQQAMLSHSSPTQMAPQNGYGGVMIGMNGQMHGSNGQNMHMQAYNRR